MADDNGGLSGGRDVTPKGGTPPVLPGQPGPIQSPGPTPPPPVIFGGPSLCPDGTIVPQGEQCPPPNGPTQPGGPAGPIPPRGPITPPIVPSPPPGPGGPSGPTPPTPGGGDPGPGGGGCPCPDGGGGGPGGGGGGGSSPTCPAPPRACKRHDGVVIDKDTGQTLTTNTYGDVYYNQDIPGCEGTIKVDSIPYCDDLPDKCPEHPAVEEGGKCCKEAFQAIADAMKEIAKAMDKKFELTKEMLDQYLDYLASKLKDKIIPPAKTCEQCCKRVELGLAEQASCAAIAANCTCQACVNSCESFNEGECCKGCGKSKCTCKEGKCIGEDTPDKKWQSYCKDDQRDIYQGDKVPTAEGWTYNGEFDSQSEAESAADDACRSTGGPGGGGGGGNGTYTPRPVNFTGRNVDICGASNLVDESTASAYLSSHSSTALALGVAIANASQNVLVGLANDLEGIPIVDAVLKGVVAETQAPIAQAIALSPAIASLTGCNQGGMSDGTVTLALAGVIGQRTGVNMEPYVLDTIYAVNAACRKRLLSPVQALAAVIADAIPMDHLDRYYAAAGYCHGIAEVDLESARQKPIVAELIGMRRRGIISEQEYSDGVRKLGYTDEQDAYRFFELAKSYPGPQDVVRFMQRDTDDPNIVDRFKLDTDFDAKYAEKLKLWAKYQGVPDEVMKYYWRAHWDIPSATALTSMYQRLRYDDIPDGTKVSIEDVRTALEQQDIAPYWIDKYIALMHPPLGRIDIRRSYQNGTLSDDETKRALGELGYSDGNIDKLFKFMQKLKEQGASNHRMIKRWVALLVDAPEVQREMQDDGYTAEQVDKALETAAPRLVSSIWARSYVAGETSEVDFRLLLAGHGVTNDSIESIVNLLSYKVNDTASVKAYTSGTITRQTALGRMVSRGMQATAAQIRLDAADDAFNSTHAAKCSTNTKGRYIRGDIDRDEAKNKLVINGIASEWADRLIGKWQCELGSKDKAVSADKLCGWFARGTISADEFKRRLIRQGFAEPDALNFLGDCADRIATKQAKEETQRQKEAEKDRKSAEANARRNESRANALVKRAEAARKAKNQLRQVRQTQELTTLKNLIKGCECTDATAVQTYNQNKDHITSQFGLTTDEANRVLLKASESWADGKPESFTELVTLLASQSRENEAEALTPEP